MAVPMSAKLWRKGRLQLGYRLYKHQYPKLGEKWSGDRWVFQPYLIWDRKD
jgi:hypothetical protein